jgi:hypothetical protein
MALILTDIDEATETPTIKSFDETSTCTILGVGKFRHHLQTSSRARIFAIILREGDHILTSAGRWDILWEDEHGSVHDSMRPPPLPAPVLTSDALEPLEVGAELH